jgi:hypothetical protein
MSTDVTVQPGTDLYGINRVQAPAALHGWPWASRADTIVPGVAVETRPTSAKGTGSLRLKVLGSPLAAVEAALDGGLGVRCAERPATFDGRQLSRIKLMSGPASGPAQP